MKHPTITAVMVTTGRLKLVHESYKFFAKQTYLEKKLLIVTDCDEKPYAEIKEIAHKDKEVLVLYVGSNERQTLGDLRNLSLEHAPSDLSIQWDDDDWYGPTRIMDQWLGLKDAKAVMLTQQLHFFRDTKQVALVNDYTGIEGTLLFDRRCGLRYPGERRGEDTVLKKQLKEKNLVNLIPGGLCYCRTYHGDNTWERGHHMGRVVRMNKPITKAQLKEAERIYMTKMLTM